MQLETFEHAAPLTGTPTEQRQQRRDAFRRFLASVLRRKMTTAEIEELRERLAEKAKRVSI